jgi:hypothetical protein
MIMSSEPIAIVVIIEHEHIADHKHVANHILRWLFFMNWGSRYLAMMILFQLTEALDTYLWWFFFLLTKALGTMLNDKSGLSETSVAAWTISYDIGYMLSSTSRTLERWKAVNSATRTESNLYVIWLCSVICFYFVRCLWSVIFLWSAICLCFVICLWSTLCLWSGLHSRTTGIRSLEIKCSYLYNSSIVNDPLHSFHKIPLHVEVLDNYLLNRIQLRRLRRKSLRRKQLK